MFLKYDDIFYNSFMIYFHDILYQFQDIFDGFNEIDR